MYMYIVHTYIALLPKHGSYCSVNITNLIFVKCCVLLYIAILYTVYMCIYIYIYIIMYMQNKYYS